MSNTKVVHVYKSDYDIYIGRGKCPNTGKISKWGNPFQIGKDGTREQVIQKYSQWILGQPDLMNSLHELKGKTLGCWCSPQACHGHLLVALIEATKPIDFECDARAKADYFSNGGSDFDF